jgi:hypothetical protein
MAITENNMHDILDVRSLIERIEELEAEREQLQDHVDACEDAYNYHDSEDTQSTPEWEELKTARAQLQEWDNGPENEERVSLMTIMEDLRGAGGDEQWRGDWYPITLIRGSYFEEYMDQLIDDIGDIPRDLPAYMRIELDYSMLQQDYTSIDIDGVDYWYR